MSLFVPWLPNVMLHYRPGAEQKLISLHIHASSMHRRHFSYLLARLLKRRNIEVLYLMVRK